MIQLKLLRKEILKRKIISKKDLEAINKKIIQEIKEAAKYALEIVLFL